MAVFIELTTDAFDENLRRQAQKKRGKENRSGRAGRRVARRPTRGIEIKDDTYAMIKVIDASGKSIPLVDSSSPDGLTKGYANFLLQSVNEQRMEKQQIVETFGDSYIFFFGEAPRMVDVQAILINSHDFNWRSEWWANYNDLLRGTRLAENGARIYLFYDDIILEGYLMQAAVSENASTPYHVTLQFKLFVTNYSNISLIGEPNFPVRSSVVLPHDVRLTDGDASMRLISRYRDGGWDSLSSDAYYDELHGRDESSGDVDDPNTSSFSEQFGPFEASGFATSSEEGDRAGVSFGTIGSQPNAGANPLARRVSDAFRSVPRSFAVSQDVWTFLFSHPEGGVDNIAKLVIRSGKPIRGLIAENTDEFVGLTEAKVRSIAGLEGEGEPPLATKGTVRSVQEVDDLWREAIQFLSCYGADINNSDSLISLGLGPNGLKVGLGGESVSFDPFSDEGRRRANDFFDRQGEKIGDQFDAFAGDPLGNVFGRPKGSTNDERLHNRPKYTEGAGDPFYGYPSDFADGQPGFGVPGFGDFGGLGFGSGSGGDPGFKDPAKFTFAGVASEQGAFERFTEPREDPTSISVGVSAGVSLGTNGLSGGAGTSVNGRPSAFALISVPGLLDETGSARQAAEAIAERQAQQRFGFAEDNPFGVSCKTPGGGGPLSYSDSFTLP